VDETEARAHEPTRSTPDDHDDHAKTNDLTVAAILRQAARLRAIELQLDAVFDLRSHTQAMRQAADFGADTSGRADTA
jgi:hypothetical protein